MNYMQPDTREDTKTLAAEIVAAIDHKTAPLVARIVVLEEQNKHLTEAVAELTRELAKHKQRAK
jgi:hypothetical protein